MRTFPSSSGNKFYGIFNDSFPPIIDGVTLTVENYAYWIMENGRFPCVVTPWNPREISVPYPVLKYLSLPIHNRHPYRYGYPKLDPFIWRKLRNTSFKIVHSHCPFSSGRLAVYVKKKQRIPLIGTFHSKYKADLDHSFKLFPFCVPIIMRRILNFYNCCDEVWIPQADVEETVRKYGYKGRLTVVENGNDFAGIIKEDIDSYKSKAKKKIGFDKKDLNILFVGQHIWEKGLKIILETIERLKSSENVKVNMIGDGYATHELQKIIISKGLEKQIKLHGLITERKKLSDFYAASDLFFFPSMYDNAPLVVREAAALGTPSLLLEGSTASEVINDGENGYLVTNNPEKIALLIKKLEQSKETLIKSGIKARNTLVRSWEDVVGEVIDRYDTLIKRFNC